MYCDNRRMHNDIIYTTVYTYIYIYVYVSMNIYMYVLACIHVYMCICGYMYVRVVTLCDLFRGVVLSVFGLVVVLLFVFVVSVYL